MILIATIFMVLFGILGIWDGIYYHDYKYKLWQHKESIIEHIIHTFRSVAFPVVVYYLFQYDFGGRMMMVGVMAVVIDFVLLAIDVRIEGYSRDRFGGLSNGEYATHLFANMFHYISITLILAAKPADAWTLRQSFEITRSYPDITVCLGSAFVTGGTVAAVWHCWLWSKFVSGKSIPLIKTN